MSNNNKQSNGKKQISRVGRSHSSRQNDRTSRNDVDSFADDLPASNSTSILEDATDSDVENDKSIKKNEWNFVICLRWKILVGLARSVICLYRLLNVRMLIYAFI